jgi:transcriptional regulator with XRE-family HTH domain
MDQPDVELNVEEILERMLEVSGAKSITELAEITGLSAQTLSQSKYRKSIALPVLMRFVAKVKNASIDYLIYGVGSKKDVSEQQGNRYADIKTISTTEDFDVILFDKRWLQVQFKGKKPEILRQCLIADRIYVIDTTDCIVTDGTYVLGYEEHLGRICKCKRKLDGTITVEGEDQPITQEALNNIGVVGRVIWTGKSLLDDPYAQYYAP